ncbi:MAG: DNA repair protein RecO [Butyrivibrio sp.]
MAEQIKVTGMVISSSPIGENDKRIVLLTREKGKISAFVRGARRPGNHLMAASDSFAFGSFYLYPGRDSYTMVNADITNYFRELASDVAKTYSAYYFLELAEYYSVENQDGTGMLNLIYAAFRALLNDKLDDRLVRYVYELKMLVLNGEYPDFFTCKSCGSRENLKGFSAFMDGVVCSKCAGHMNDVISVGKSTLYTLQYIVCTDIGKLYTFTVSDEVLTELKMIAGRCMHTYIDRKMNSLEILEALS